jgi:hypothetical protein
VYELHADCSRQQIAAGVATSWPGTGMDTSPTFGLVRLFPKHMDWMGLEKNEKMFDLFGIQTHPIPLNPHGLRANRTSPSRVFQSPLIGRNGEKQKTIQRQYLLLAFDDLTEGN